MQARKPSDIFRRPGVFQAAAASIPSTLFYLGLIWAIVAALPDRAWNIKNQTLVAMSLFGFWRYAWQLLHVVRHWLYRRRVFPRLRGEAMSLVRKYPENLYIMTPSFREEPEVSQLVFSALVREAQTVPSKVFLYASVGSEEEAEFISKVINAVPGGHSVETVFMYQQDGKRIAMGSVLRAIARKYYDPYAWRPDSRDDVVVFMDGDTLVEPGIFQKTLPYFRSNPQLGALTTDNLGISPEAAGVFQDWYTLKFAQRNHVFNSHSLSKRVLTITGRFSMYRANVVVNEEFIRFLEADYLDHWLFGRFRFLMGDDKSTWFYLLKEGMEMLYIPDAAVAALETRQSRFFRTSLSLMRRWYGNMLRNNWRTVKLGPKPMGGFIWWCVLDQRFSTFTPLVGPVAILLLGMLDSWFYLAFYAAWVLLTRLALMWIYVLEGMPMTLLHIPLTVYNQWVGSLIKIYSMHNLSNQTWSKGAATERRRAGGRAAGDGLARAFVRFVLLAFNMAMLAAVCGLVSGAIMLPGRGDFAPYFVAPASAAAGTRRAVPKPAVRKATACDAGEINAAIASHRDGETLDIVLPAGRIVLDSPIRVNKSGIRIHGAGEGGTILASRFSKAGGAAAVIVGGRKGPVIGRSVNAINKGDKVVAVDGRLKDVKYVRLGAPNDDAFFDAVGDTHWRGKKPWIRQFIAEVAGRGEGYLVLKQGTPNAFPSGTEIRAARLVSNVTLSDFTLVRETPGAALSDVRGVYENLFPEYAVDGVRFDWAIHCLAENIEIIGAGRHPLVFENCRNIEARDMRIEGALNKGKGGAGYVRFARCFDSALRDSEVADVRHLTMQWGAVGNLVENCVLKTDVNFHGGWARNNMIRDCVIEPPEGHRWGRVTRMPEGGAGWAPPDGAGNVVTNE